MREHPLKEIIKLRRQGIPAGVYSICSANEYVIEAAMEKALADGSHVLVEATANQVNQYGGYTGMTARDFSGFVFSIAKKVSLPEDKVILGGDHLGPLVWKNENSSQSMEKACELVRQYVLAGFTKIHLDTSMHLGDDRRDLPLETSIIAERGAVLCKSAQEAYELLKQTNIHALQPVYVIGSEVPVPGGSCGNSDGLQITKVGDFRNTVEAFKKSICAYCRENIWENIIAVVVQPGVEFGDDTIHEYEREAAKELCDALKEYPDLVFEGHSTDYQTAENLKRMVEDGIAVLKVGPALTFAMREALFALSYMEKELFRYNPEVRQSNFIETLETAMLRNPDNWKKHYVGDPVKIRYASKFSLSDRCRYYLPAAEVKESINILIDNLMSTHIPLTLVDQFMPLQYQKIRKGLLENNPKALLKDRIKNVIDDYRFAVSCPVPSMC